MLSNLNQLTPLYSLPLELQHLIFDNPDLLQFVTELLEKIDKLGLKLNELEKQLKKLIDQKNLDSHNSSKPPSSDLARNKSTEDSDNSSSTVKRKPGAQKGHKGMTLARVENPDKTVLHEVKNCSHCGFDLSTLAASEVEKRQVFDIPPLKLEVTEHQSEVKVCPSCRCHNRGEFPDGVTQGVQYGEGVKGFLTYLNQYQLIPYELAAELCEDLFGCAISQGTLLNALKTSYKNLEKTEEAIKEKIIRSDVLHVDESGVYGVEKREWLHTSSTETHTHYHLDSQRGQEGINRGGILCKSQGTAVHDHWEPYKKYSNCAHAYCNAHHLRELTRAYEQDGANWALEMKNLLLKIKESVDEAKENGKKELDVLIRDNFTRGYEAIVEEGLKSYPSEKLENARAPGRKKQCKSKNLLDRLSAHQEETLRFMSDFKVPFDNNLAERDLRMVKVKQKISGCFRSKEGGKYFCRIRGFISTLKKQGKNVLEYLRKAFVPSNGNSNLLQEG